MGRMIETSPWPEQPRPMPAAKKYSIEPYKGFYAVMKEVAGRKELVVVAVYKKGVRHEAHDWNGWKIPRALPESP
jgi:hypothetical protein